MYGNCVRCGNPCLSLGRPKKGDFIGDPLVTRIACSNIKCPSSQFYQSNEARYRETNRQRVPILTEEERKHSEELYDRQNWEAAWEMFNEELLLEIKRPRSIVFNWALSGEEVEALQEFLEKTERYRRDDQ